MTTVFEWVAVATEPEVDAASRIGDPVISQSSVANWQERRRIRLTQPSPRPLLDRIYGRREPEVHAIPLTWMERMRPRF